MKPRIVFFGTPEFVIPIVKTLAVNFNLVGIVTAPDSIQGRKKLLTPSAVKQYSIDSSLRIPILTPQQFNNETMQQLKNLTPDLFVVAAYGKIIPKEIIDIPPFGSVNIHPSLLPKYRGPSPIQSALLAGDKESGITIIKMDEKMDHGPIIAQWTYPLSPKNTFADLHISMFQEAADHLPNILRSLIKGEITPLKQNDSEATYCKMITKESGYFSLDNPPTPDMLDRMIRAFYPWPTAWTKGVLKQTEVRIKFLPDKKLQIEGGKPMNLKEFLNGYPEMKYTIQKLFELSS